MLIMCRVLVITSSGWASVARSDLQGALAALHVHVLGRGGAERVGDHERRAAVHHRRGGHVRRPGPLLAAGRAGAAAGLQTHTVFSVTFIDVVKQSPAEVLRVALFKHPAASFAALLLELSLVIIPSFGVPRTALCYSPGCCELRRKRLLLVNFPELLPGRLCGNTETQIQIPARRSWRFVCVVYPSGACLKPIKTLPGSAQLAFMYVVYPSVAGLKPCETLPGSAQLAFVCVVYPAVVISYLGQAAYLWVHPEDVASTFYQSIPDPVYWPLFCISVLAAIVASQVPPASASQPPNSAWASGACLVHTALALSFACTVRRLPETQGAGLAVACQATQHAVALRGVENNS